MTPDKKDLSPKSAYDFLHEFKKFAFKGNMVDLAVGMVVGGAFIKIVNSLVENIIIPITSIFMFGNETYKEWILYIGEKKIPFGIFLGDLVSFLLINFVLFIFLRKFLGWSSQINNNHEKSLRS